MAVRDLSFGIFDLRFAIEDFESEMPVGIELYGKMINLGHIYRLERSKSYGKERRLYY